MDTLHPHITPTIFPDLAVPTSTAVILWMIQDLQPILQILILVLTLAFLALGVALRWRTLHQEDRAED
jgi:hypothetical protein